MKETSTRMPHNCQGSQPEHKMVGSTLFDHAPEELTELLTESHNSLSVIDLQNESFRYIHPKMAHYLGLQPDAETGKYRLADFYACIHPDHCNDIKTSVAIAYETLNPLPCKERKEFVVILDCSIKNSKGSYVRMLLKLKHFLSDENGRMQLVTLVVETLHESEGDNRLNPMLYHAGNNHITPLLKKDKLHSKSRFLSERELEVLILAIAGFTIDEIARKLFLDYDTIVNHRRKIFTKTGTHKILQAYRISLLMGVIPLLPLHK